MHHLQKDAPATYLSLQPQMATMFTYSKVLQTHSKSMAKHGCRHTGLQASFAAGAGIWLCFNR